MKRLPAFIAALLISAVGRAQASDHDAVASLFRDYDRIVAGNTEIAAHLDSIRSQKGRALAGVRLGSGATPASGAARSALLFILSGGGPGPNLANMDAREAVSYTHLTLPTNREV